MNAPSIQTRYEQRKRWTPEVRQELVENDLDEKDRQLVELRQELRGVKQILIGILISTSTAAIVGAVNLLLSRGA